MRNQQQGLSLIEVMIAMTIGAVMTVGMVQLFVANSDTARLTAGQSRIQESARFAFDFIGRSLEQAGYRGCLANGERFLFATRVVQVYGGDDRHAYEFDLNFPVEGFSGIGVLWQPDPDGLMPDTTDANVDSDIYYQQLDATEQGRLNALGQGTNTGIDIAGIVNDTDIFVSRFAVQQDVEARLEQPLNTDDDTIIIHTPPGGPPVVQDHMALVQDCQKAAVFKVTSVDEDVPSAGLTTVGKSNAGSFPIRNDLANLGGGNSFTQTASVMAIDSHTYYIAPGIGVNNEGNTPLSLWRKSSLNAPIELVEGVEDMAILWGEDPDLDGIPNRYIPATNVSEWSQVATARVTLVINSVDDVGGNSGPTHGCTVQDCYADAAIDGLLRRSFTQTFKLRNAR